MGCSIDVERIIYHHTKYNGYVMLIPVPELRKNYAGKDIAHSYLSIELLFSDEIIEKYCKKLKVSGGHTIYKFNKDDKAKFAKKVVPTLKKEDFENFKPLFETIKWIIKMTNNAK